jgi:hypothetical protein
MHKDPIKNIHETTVIGKGNSQSTNNLRKDFDLREGGMEGLIIDTTKSKVYDEGNSKPVVILDRVHKAVRDDMKIHGSNECIFHHK